MLQTSDSDVAVLDLLDPSSANTVVGKIYISCSVEVSCMIYNVIIGCKSSIRFNICLLIFGYIDRIQLKQKKVLQGGSYLSWYV